MGLAQGPRSCTCKMPGSPFRQPFRAPLPFSLLLAFFSAPSIYFAWRKAWGGVCAVGQCQRPPLGPGIWLELPTACDSLPAFVESFPGRGPVGPFLDSVFQD